jgi:hypothetical protein
MYMRLILHHVNDIQVESNRGLVLWKLTDGFVVYR